MYFVTNPSFKPQHQETSDGSDHEYDYDYIYEQCEFRELYVRILINFDKPNDRMADSLWQQ